MGPYIEYNIRRRDFVVYSDIYVSFCSVEVILSQTVLCAFVREAAAFGLYTPKQIATYARNDIYCLAVIELHPLKRS